MPGFLGKILINSFIWNWRLSGEISQWHSVCLSSESSVFS